MINKFKVGDFVKLRPNAVVLDSAKGAEFYVVAKVGVPWITLVTSNGRTIFTCPDEIELTKPPGGEEKENKIKMLNGRISYLESERKELLNKLEKAEMKAGGNLLMAATLNGCHDEVRRLRMANERLLTERDRLGTALSLARSGVGEEVKNIEIGWPAAPVKIYGRVKRLSIHHPESKIAFFGYVKNAQLRVGDVLADVLAPFECRRAWSFDCQYNREEEPRILSGVYGTIEIRWPKAPVLVYGEVETLTYCGDLEELTFYK